MKKPKIIVRKLGREKAWGQQEENKIEIDPRQSSRDFLDTLIHEALHFLEPDWDEEKIINSARTLTALIWESNFRRIHD